ncbi:LysR substrate-binding domain-containing protein [Pseudooceanicola sp. C21-150M6]|uniref:LysR substrate-binding domain-containing protein n=1 Tax=Pseudooceanicola sp. C21-150M6 TaxID=3434355 RepID=UPI003D7F211F
MPRPYDLPSLTALVCFEAAARNLSFKAAAAELNVTPAAVSHQMKGLESSLGAALFRRQHRGVDLTETGAYLFVSLQRSFESISDTVRDIRGASEDVTVQATTAVSAFWLTPQIAEFWKAHPEITVSQMVSDGATAGTRADLTIRYGDMGDEEGDCRLLFHDEIIAVATPDFAAQYGVGSVEALRSVPLIHMEAAETGWTTWADWFAALGAEGPTGRRVAVNNHMIALQLARDGAGAVLGWTGLIGPLLERGELVRLVPDSMPSPHPFYLRMQPGASARALVLRDWLARGRG